MNDEEYEGAVALHKDEIAVIKKSISDLEQALRDAEERLAVVRRTRQPYKRGDVILVKRQVGANHLQLPALIERVNADEHFGGGHSFTYTFRWWLKKEQDWDPVTSGAGARDVTGLAPADGPWAKKEI